MPAPDFPRRTSLNIGHDIPRIREQIVALHGWKLMGNHVHLLLSEKAENGLSMFLQKMRGYGRYFNERHERRGRLFDVTKKVRIEQEEHFLYILHYIHLNGLDDLPGAQKWRERDKGTVQNVDRAIARLKADKWSSFRDYCGIRNFPSLLVKEPFETEPAAYLESLTSYLTDREEDDLSPYILE